jgi:hypothetical protein
MYCLNVGVVRVQLHADRECEVVQEGWNEREQCVCAKVIYLEKTSRVLLIIIEKFIINCACFNVHVKYYEYFYDCKS